MKKIGTFLVLVLLTVSAFSQSYERMETRFLKTVPSAEDSTAFVELGKQKAKSLFDRTQFYVQNTSNRANQDYVRNTIPDLFYVEPGDSLQVDEIITAVQEVQSNLNGKPVQLRCVDKEGYLGKIETVNCKPKMEFNLVLKKIVKTFGSKSEEVWEVFLNEPVVIP